MGDGNACAVIWIHIFNYANMYIWLCQDTGAMNRPLRLAECSPPISWVDATLLTNRQHVIANRWDTFGKPLAALRQTVSSRRGRFIVPAYMNTPTKWRTKMRVRWNINTCAVKWICIFDYARIRARWIGPYAWRNVRNQFRGYSPRIRNPFEMPSRNVRNVFILCMLHIHYAKVWFLRHKSMVFGVQKPPFYIAKTPFLKYQNGVLNLEHIRQY